MSTSVIIGIALAVIVFAYVIFAIGRGSSGESKVAFQLKRLPKEYHTLNDIIIQNGNATAQIDHIIVSPYGIFVIENKDYTGWIYGQEQAYHWTQNIYGHKYQLYNPIFQNDSHIKALKKYLEDIGEYDQLPLISIIAFSDRAKINVRTQKAHIVYFSQLLKTIKSYSEQYITDENASEIAEFIFQHRYVGTLANSLHIDHARQAKKSTEERIQHSIELGFCPRCGGHLVKRNGKYGEFLGCSNYPDCKFTQNL